MCELHGGVGKGTKKGVFPVEMCFAEQQFKRRHAMKLEVSVPEVVEIINGIQQALEKLFEMMRLDFRKK